MQNVQDTYKSAQEKNIMAAKAITETVRSTLGPAGMDKLMMDAGGNVIVTNDGATILQELDVAHPGAEMIIEAANMQESLCYDGTTSTVVLAGQLLENTQGLFNKGIHPNIICRGYRQANRWAIDHLDTLKINAKEHLHSVAQTSITGKSLESAMEHVSSICVSAVEAVEGDYDRIRVLCQPGGSIDDSYCFNGVILHKEFMLPSMQSKPSGNLLLVNTGLEADKIDDNLQIQFKTAQELQSYRQQTSREVWVNLSEQISKLLPEGGALLVRDSVNETLAAMLARKGISIAQRLPPSDLTAISHLLGTSVAHSIEDMTEPSTATIEQKTIGDMDYIVIESNDDSQVCTLVLRGATKQTLDETERGFEDALGVVSLAYSSGEVVAGGGSAYISMAQHLRQRAAEVGGRQQMAVESFADALEIIPATIAENAGHDPLDTILALRNEHINGSISHGPNIEDGGVIDMLSLGVLEPLSLIRQCLNSASEVSISILRIDDIFGRKTEGGNPQPPGM